MKIHLIHLRIKYSRMRKTDMRKTDTFPEISRTFDMRKSDTFSEIYRIKLIFFMLQNAKSFESKISI